MSTSPDLRGGIANDGRHALALRRALEEHLAPGSYATFFVTGEGRELPGGGEDASGYVIDTTGRVFSFWLGWDPRQRRAALTEWEQVEPEADWAAEPEYRRAREKLGLPT